MTGSDRTVTDALDRPELAPLWRAARERLERNGRTVTSSPIRLDGLSDGEVAAICGLLSRRRPRSNDMRVNLVEVDSVLRSGPTARGLVDTLEAMSGPVRDRKAERAALTDQRVALWTAAGAHPVVARHEPVRQWLDSLRRRGRIARIDADDPVALLTGALDTVEWLLAHRDETIERPIPLSVLAAVRLGDGHALDSDSPLGTLLADALCELSGLSDPRAAWAHFGVQLDRVSSSALALMLPGGPGTIAGAACATAEPLRVTHRMVERGFGLDLGSTEVVWVCENPAVLSLAADRLGDRCRPLVCLEGMPSSVTSALLRTLCEAGVELRVHADLDRGGVAITSHLVERFGATTWRMGAEDYLAALDGPTSELHHPIGSTPWDPELSHVMNEHRRAVHEEAVLDALLADLDAR